MSDLVSYPGVQGGGGKHLLFVCAVNCFCDYYGIKTVVTYLCGLGFADVIYSSFTSQAFMIKGLSAGIA